MNANSSDRASTTKTRLLLAGVAATTLALGACVPPAPQAPYPPRQTPPTSAAPPATAPTSRPTPPVAPPTNWRDAPATAGTWRFTSAPEGSRADFMGLFSMRCVRTDRSVVLSMAGSHAQPSSSLTFTSDARRQSVPARPGNEGLSAVLASSDPLLDAIAFSRGRFRVEAPDGRALVLPSWPEVARVIEDCR